MLAIDLGENRRQPFGWQPNLQRRDFTIFTSPDAPPIACSPPEIESEGDCRCARLLDIAAQVSGVLAVNRALIAPICRLIQDIRETDRAQLTCWGRANDHRQ